MKVDSAVQHKRLQRVDLQPVKWALILRCASSGKCYTNEGQTPLALTSLYSLAPEELMIL
jgi:hypothetical protein